MNNDSTSTGLALAAVLRRNAHELRNRLSALISAVDVMGMDPSSSSALFEEALELLTESATDLRDLADGWSRCAVDMFEQVRCEVGSSELADLVAEACDAEVAREPGELTIRVDPRVAAEAFRWIATLTRPDSIRVRTLVRHELPFVAVVFETPADRGSAAIESEPVLAMLEQISGHPRIDGDELIIQLPAQRMAMRAASVALR